MTPLADIPHSHWIEPEAVSVPEAFERAIGGHPLVSRLLFRRGITTSQAAKAFLDPQFYLPTSGVAIPDLNKSTSLLQEAVEDGKRICVWGDFDVDGQTATTLLVSGLREIGGRVNFHIPVRAAESHGVNLPVLKKLMDQGMDLLVTCDTGIAAHKAVKYARSRGVQVVVTDHHYLPPELPEADAVVNPRRLPVGHPLGGLPGVGVAYKVIEALYQRLGAEDALPKFLDLVAMGIVADLADLTGDTRYLLQRGLEILRNTGRLGLQVLMEIAELDAQWLTEEHIGFVLAPRLNALGRLDDANGIVDFLTTDDPGQARLMAYHLDGLNGQRKLLTDQVFQGALTQIERNPKLLDPAVLIIAHPNWPGGVIGIVASRLVERYHKPTVVITIANGQPARGSARSVEGCNISAAIEAQKDLLQGFGGHPMAAGLSLDPALIDEFRIRLSRTVAEMLGEAQIKPQLRIDGYLALSELNLDLVQDLERLGPFGPGNEALHFASRRLRVIGHSIIGRSGDHLKLLVEDEAGFGQEVLWWNGAGWPLPEGYFDLAYTVRASNYRGQRDLQVEWVEARPLEEPVVEISRERKQLQVIDLRWATNPLTLLERLGEEQEIQIWCEGDMKEKLGGRDRYELVQGDTLVIWTAPPGQRELTSALDMVQPKKVIVFGIRPEIEGLEEFLKHLAGQVKYALSKKDGQASNHTLAAAAAQPEAAVRLGLRWLEARGMIRILEQAEAVVRFEKGDVSQEAEPLTIQAELALVLEETTAYRNYFLTSTDLEKIFQ